MLILPNAAQLHLAKESKRLTAAGVIYRNDGSTLRCTQSQADLTINTGDLAGTYYAVQAVTGSDMQSGADMSVDNLEISSALGANFSGFVAADIEAGLFDNAPFEMFYCQWDNPNAWQKVARRGYLGQITRSSEGTFQAEWRGMTQLLSQNIGRSYGENCDVARFGDNRCKIDLTTVTGTGVVTAVRTRRDFTVVITWPDGVHPAGYADLGEVHWVTGANSPSYVGQIRDDDTGSTLGRLTLWESLPYDVQIGDTLTVVPGCDRLWETCQAKANTANFRGHGRWSPGIPKIIRAPG